MTVLGLNHINIRTPELQGTLEFCRTVLGMEVTPVAGHNDMSKAAWVHDASGAPILHIASADVAYSSDEILPENPPTGSGAIHHLALTCANFSAVRERLCQLEINFRENIPEQGVRQLFVQDPTGITFELNFNER